jgi:lipoprotein-anchoring transpeptidase ErfK/SrfK
MSGVIAGLEFGIFMRKPIVCCLLTLCIVLTGCLPAFAASAPEGQAAGEPAVHALAAAEEGGPEPYTVAWVAKYAPGSAAPFEEQVGDNGDYEDILFRPPHKKYRLTVDYYNQTVWAHSKDENGGYTVLERVMICTTGGNGVWTPEGVYAMDDDYHRFGYFPSFNCYAQYWTQMWGNFYFHSILYSARDAAAYTMSSYRSLGTPGSHGCIRMLVPDARWLYENCAPGTECEVTIEYSKDETLKNILRSGYEGAIDYIRPNQVSLEDVLNGTYEAPPAKLNQVSLDGLD